jgi:hypothetical protein
MPKDDGCAAYLIKPIHGESGFVFKLMIGYQFQGRKRTSVDFCIEETQLDVYRRFFWAVMAEVQSQDLPENQTSVLRFSDAADRPIQEVYQRRMENGHFRTEALNATILPGHRNRGPEKTGDRQKTSRIRNALILNHNLTEGADEAFPLVGHALGGPVELYNFVPYSMAAANSRNFGLPAQLRVAACYKNLLQKLFKAFL